MDSHPFETANGSLTIAPVLSRRLWHLDIDSSRISISHWCWILLHYHWTRNASCCLDYLEMSLVSSQTITLSSYHRSQSSDSYSQPSTTWWNGELSSSESWWHTISRPNGSKAQTMMPQTQCKRIQYFLKTLICIHMGWTSFKICQRFY